MLLSVYLPRPGKFNFDPFAKTSQPDVLSEQDIDETLPSLV